MFLMFFDIFECEVMQLNSEPAQPATTPKHRHNVGDVNLWASSGPAAPLCYCGQVRGRTLCATFASGPEHPACGLAALAQAQICGPAGIVAADDLAPLAAIEWARRPVNELQKADIAACAAWWRASNVSVVNARANGAAHLDSWLDTATQRVVLAIDGAHADAWVGKSLSTKSSFSTWYNLKNCFELLP